MTSIRIPAFVLCVAAVLACGRNDAVPQGDTAAQEAAAAGVIISRPTDGDSVSLPFTVTLMATGVEVVPASGVAEPGRGHHHLLIDGDATPDSLPLPAAPLVIPLGTGASEYVVDSLSPGPHRIIAIFAAGDHVPMTTVARDTITVVVR